MMAAALALAAAVSWGIADFLGGVKSRALSTVAILIVAQPVGGVLLGAWVGIRGEGLPGAGVLWACLAAAFGTTGLIAFYRGMAAGALSIVAPIAGASAAIPVAWGLVRGDHPSAYQQLGFLAAMAGIVLASRQRRREAARLAAGVGWAAVAMLAFGGYYVPMHAASRGDFLWAAFVFRATSTALVAVVWIALRPRRACRSDLPVLAGIGVLDTGGNVLFAAASARGVISIVSILASLYPVTTVLLARAVLRERVERAQELGIVLALVGTVLVSAG
jgi:drug/metabolite transporter (DMT)-like permease